MKKCVRITAWMLAVILCLPISGWVSAENEAVDSDYILNIDLGQIKPKVDGNSSVQMGKVDTVTLESHNGKTGWLLDSSKGTDSSYIGVNIDNNMLYQLKDGECFDIEVDYYDSINAPFQIVYDAIGNSAKCADIHSTKNTLDWKTTRWTVDDAYFGDKCSGFDFEVAIRSTMLSQASLGNVVISGIRVKKHSENNRVRNVTAKSSELGNIFANGQEKKFTVGFESFSDLSETVKITYEAVDDRKNIQWTESDELTINPRETVETEININADRYCCYDLVVTVEGNGFTHINKWPFSYINSIADGTHNDRQGISNHFAWSGYLPEEQLPIIHKMGFGFSRGSMYYRILDPIDSPDGSFVMDENYVKCFEISKKYGLKWMLLMGLGNKKYDVDNVTTPKTDYQIEMFKKYADNLCTYLEDNEIPVVCLELWNEPNLTSFAGKNNTPEIFLNLLEQVGKMLKQKHPNMTVAPFGITNLYSDVVFNDWYMEYLKRDIDQYYNNNLALHAYDRMNIPETNQLPRMRQFKEAYEQKHKDDTDYKPLKIYHTEHNYPANLGEEPTEEGQARKDMRCLLGMLAQGTMEAHAMYTFATRYPGNEHSMKDNTYGLVRSCEQRYAQNNGVNYVARPIAVAMTAYNNIFQNAEAKGNIVETDTDFVYMYKRPRDNKDLIAAWTVGEKRNITIDLGTDEAVFYDLYGNATTVNSNDGKYYINFTNEPVYIEGNFKNPHVVDNQISIPTSFIAAQGDEIKINMSNTDGLSYDIETVTSKDMHVVGTSGTLDKSGYIKVIAPSVMSFEEKVTNPSELTDDEFQKLTVYLKKDGIICQTVNVYIQPMEKTNITLRTSLRSNANLNYWNMEAFITNNQTSKPLCGSLTITEPNEFASVLNPIPVNIIPAQSTGVVRFKLPKLKNLLAYYVRGYLTLDNGDIIDVYDKIEFAVMLRTDQPPQIDGVMDDKIWNRDSAMISNTENQIYLAKGYTYGGINDISAKIYSMYDDENIYMFYDVTDDIHFITESGSNVWKNDSIQLGISLNNEKADSVIGGGFTKLTVGQEPSGNVYVDRNASIRNELPQGEVKGTEAAVKRIGTHTYYEFKIPWSEITATEIDFDALDTIGFSTIINDNDGAGRKGWAKYGEGLGKGEDATLFTYIKLVK